MMMVMTTTIAASYMKKKKMAGKIGFILLKKVSLRPKCTCVLELIFAHTYTYTGTRTPHSLPSSYVYKMTICANYVNAYVFEYVLVQCSYSTMCTLYTYDVRVCNIIDIIVT